MINILLNGCYGHMGQAVIKCAADYENVTIIEGIDLLNKNDMSFPVYNSFSDVTIRPDVIIDFSHPSVLNDMLMYAISNNVPIVICTTGYSKEEVESIHNASQRIPIFYSGNMSLGINVLIELAKKAASVFGNNFDIEIIEKHHNQKLDAPSGTALMIANGIKEELNDKEFIYDRHERREKRNNSEIGIHSVRGGTIVGEHEVIFAGHDELVTISHQAQSKEVFANGAIKAATFIVGKEPKIYQMSDILK